MSHQARTYQRALPKLKLDEAEPVNISSVTGYSTAAQVNLDSIAVGRARQNGVVVAVMDMAGDSGADGLLGMSFLKRYKFAVDAKHQLLQLQPK